MDFDDSTEEAAFRAEAREWLARNALRFVWPPHPAKEDRLRLCRGWMAAKADAGYAGFTLPTEIGGRGGTPIEEVIFREEEWKFMSSSTDEAYALGAGMAIPTLLAHASADWVEKLARPTLRGDVLWCQLFSEPGAGSDIAGFRTRALRDGDDWIVNGQKIWTSGAHNADWGLLLTRTDPTLPKHKGLTYFLVDMHSPGVEVRPLKQISGRADFNEVFFTDVRIPDHQRLGEINGGWTVAMTTMMNERLTLSGDASVARNVIAPLLRIATRTASASGARMISDGACRERIASYYVAVAGMQHIAARLRTALARGETPGPEATIGKVTLTKWLQEMSAYAMDIAGPAGDVVDAAEDPDLAEVQEAYFLAVGFRMGGGTEEIAKNIIAERILGLPQDARPDKKGPFNQTLA